MTLRQRAALAATLVAAALSPALSPSSAALVPSSTPAAAPAPAGTVTLSEVEAVGTAATAAYTFSAVREGKPVRWDPCTPVHWVSSSRGAPTGSLPVLKSAVARVAQLTGTTWVYDGAVTTTPTSAYLPRTHGDYPPVLLGWADARSSDLLRGTPSNVLGVARTAWYGTRDAAGVERVSTRAGVVAFDRTDRLPLRGATSWHAVALHELGHVMGLSHATDGSQLMHAVLPRTVSDFQAGDRAGLAKVGRQAGCLPS